MTDLPPNQPPSGGGFPPPPPPPPPGGFAAPPPGQPIPGVPGGTPTYASWAQRVGAALIEGVPIFFISVFLGQISTALGALGNLALTALGFYFLYMTGEEGASPGKKLMGLRVVHEQTGRPIGGGLGIVRGIAHIVDGIICGIGYLFPLWDPKRQTLADKIMTTVVITGAPKQPFSGEIFKVSSRGM